MTSRVLKYSFLIVVFASCKKENALDCFKSNGAAVVENRYPGMFTSVKVFDKIDLDIVIGSTCKVEVSAYKNIIKNISTVIKDGVLYINNNNECNFVRGYKKSVKVTVTLPRIIVVENRGVGTTRFSDDFFSDSLSVIAESSGDIQVNGRIRKLSTYSNGNGDIYLNGSCDSLNVFMRGTNFLFGESFVIREYVFAQTQSIGDCYLNASQAKKIEYIIYQAGNIYYKGTPATIANLSSESATGRLVKED